MSAISQASTIKQLVSDITKVVIILFDDLPIGREFWKSNRYSK